MERNEAIFDLYFRISNSIIALVKEEHPLALKLCPQAGKRIASLTRSAGLQEGFSLEGKCQNWAKLKD